MWWFILIVIVILADQASKRVVPGRASANGAARAVPAILVTPSSNPRLGFGLVGRRRLLVPAAALVVVCALGFPALFSPLHDVPYYAGLALAAGGALSNATDLALRGATLDFIRIPGIMICNLADIAICAGAGLMIVGILQSV